MRVHIHVFDQRHNSRYRVSMPEVNINNVLISILMLPCENPIDPKPSSRLNTHVSSTASRLNLGILTNFTLIIHEKYLNDSASIPLFQSCRGPNDKNKVST